MPRRLPFLHLLILVTIPSTSALQADTHAFVANTSNASTLSFVNKARGTQTAGLALGIKTVSAAVYSGSNAFVIQTDPQTFSSNTIIGYSLLTGKQIGTVTFPVESLGTALASLATQTLYLLASLSNQQSVVYTLNPQTFTYQQVFASSSSLVASAVSPDGKTLYLASVTSLLVLDTTTFQQKQSLLIDGIDRITASPDGQRLYLTVSNQLVALDLQSSTVAGTVPADFGAYVAISPDSSTVYTTLIANSSNGPINIEEVSAATMTVTNTAAVGSVNGTSQGPPLAISPDGTELAIVAATGPAPSVTEVSVPSLTPGTVTPVGNACGVAFPSKTEISVTNCGANTVEIVDTTSQKVLAQLDAGPSPQNTLTGLNGKVLYVSNPYGVWAIAIRSGRILSKVEFPASSSSVQLALSASGQALFASTGSGVAAISTSTNLLIGYIAGIPSGFSVSAIAASPDGKSLFVSGQAADFPGDYRLLVLDQNTGNLLTNVTAPALGLFLIVSPDSLSVYFEGIYQEATYSVFTYSVARGEFIPLPVAADGGGMVLSPDGKTLYIALGDDSAVGTYNLSSQSVSSLPSPVTPVNIAVTPDGSQLVVTSTSTSLGLINIANPIIGAEILVNAGTSGISVH